ncbi:MAG: hypothetical protein KDB14_21710 [Planctomycetales bacterium]|nr:hypothetical protein [Planctomycetales bacterium]
MAVVLMLEDDRDRIRRFEAVLSGVCEPEQFVVHRTAVAFIAGLSQLSAVPDLIALDHDLFPDHPDDPDPGDGRDVARHLAQLAPCSPVLIHSTNVHAAESMRMTLEDAGWKVDRIAPLGEDWIEAYWKMIAFEMLAR